MTLLTFRFIFLSSAISLAISPLFVLFTKRIGFVDVPGSAPHKQHEKPMPLAGGWVVGLSVLFLVMGSESIHSPKVWSILIPSGIVFLFGIWDDARGASAPIKLTGQTIASLIVIILGNQVQLFDPKFQLLNIVITLLWIVGITNAFNFVDSMDGLATGLAGLAAAFFMLATFDAEQIDLSLFSAVLLGACIGIYFFNASPAHLFLGDSGSQWLGFCLASLAIAYNPQGFLRTQSWFVPILLVGVPIFDTCLVVFSRLRRGKPVYRAHFDHTYHRLVSFGMNSNRAVLLMHLVALFLGCLAFITITLPPIWANIVYASCVMLLVVSIGIIDSKNRWP